MSLLLILASNRHYQHDVFSFFFKRFIYVSANISFVLCSILVSLSSKLADEIDLVLFCGFTVSSVSVLEEDLDLSNELNLLNAMSLSHSLLIGFLFLVLDACCFSVFKLPITALTFSSVVGTNGLFE